MLRDELRFEWNFLVPLQVVAMFLVVLWAAIADGCNKKALKDRATLVNDKQIVGQ